MPPADLRRRLLAQLPQVVALALSLQLVAAAGALSGPWAVTPVGSGAARAAAAPAGAPPVEANPVRAQPGRTASQGPVRLSAPGIWEGAVEAGPLGLDPTGALEVPATADRLGWWGDGPRPGSPGAAVVVGHVDLDGRRGVFGRLAHAEPGTVVSVSHSDGSVVRFRVVRVDRYAKSDFPTDTVYAPTENAELRLVTCGGRFDPRTGHYADNVVVVAVPA